MPSIITRQGIDLIVEKIKQTADPSGDDFVVELSGERWLFEIKGGTVQARKLEGDEYHTED